MTAQLIKIKDIADVMPGLSIKRRTEDEPNGAYQVLLARHLSGSLEYSYKKEDQLRMDVDVKRIDKYRVSSGDVLFVSRGSSNYAGAVIQIPECTIASSVFFILRPKQQVDPVYLAWCINQPPIRAAIAAVRTGAGSPIVQRAIFEQIAVPVPALERQTTIAELAKSMKLERDLKVKQIELTESYHDGVGTKILQDLMKGKQA